MIFGKSEKELFNALKEMDQSTSVEYLRTTSKEITISAQKDRNGKVKSWAIIEDDNYKTKNPTYQKKGRNLGSLQKALQTMDKTVPYNEELNVLCYHSTDVVETEDGKIKSKWFNIEPCIPFELKGDNVIFQFIELVLTKDEYAMMMETRLALYNEFSGCVYPIRQVALSSLGKLLDSVVAFKNLTELPLGSALMLAEKLSSSRNLQFIYRDRTQNIKPLIGVAGLRYAKLNQEDYFKHVLNYASNNSVCFIDKWKITDETSEATIIIDELNPNYTLYLLAKTGDIPGFAMSIEAYAKVGKASVLLKRNRVYHTQSFEYGTGIPKLFDGIYEAFDLFKDMYEKLENCEVYYNDLYVNGVKKYVGKKRFNEIANIENEVYKGIDLYKLILNNTYFQLKEKQANELASYYFKLMIDMVKDSYQYKKLA